MTRGRVVSLTPEQVVTRALYLAGERTVHDLDDHVLVRTNTPEGCPTIYYRLTEHNGGTDPTAPDPASRWSEEDATGISHPRITCDCMGGAAWCGGFDRYQPVRMRPSIGYGGAFNTNSMILDITLSLIGNEVRSFESLRRPEPGSMIVCKSGSPGHTVGHVGTVVGYQLAEWDPTQRACWEAIEVVDVAGRKGRANKRTTGIGWRGTGALFVRSLMTP